MTEEEREERVKELVKLAPSALMEELQSVRARIELKLAQAVVVEEEEEEEPAGQGPTRVHLPDLSPERLAGISADVLTVSAPAKALSQFSVDFIAVPGIDDFVVFLEGNEPCSVEQIKDLLEGGDISKQEQVEIDAKELRKVLDSVPAA